MSTSIDSYREAQRERFVAFRYALSEESDRGCALFAAAYLDRALSDLLYVCLVPDKKIDDELFKGQAPLSTFSARIKMAYYIGKISVGERRDFETIRGIRNDFAHHAEYIDFEFQSIQARCGNLTNHWHEQGARPRAKFTATVSALLAMLHTETIKTLPFKKKSGTPISEDTKIKIRADAKQVGRP